ncbi:hypothetical protein KGM_209678 [Danaus plexippus plexippus]|uniref:Uncharacterized protein n=1 Tax=Danaus plexippus plexippus TaxID=278856 RepID=A0A212EY06_DANPL|nr:hypothetical protein KGM_209678 [Danaus plexippus plexippus]
MAPQASGASPSAPKDPKAPQAPTVNAWFRHKAATPTASVTATATSQDINKFFGEFDSPELLIFSTQLKASGNAPVTRLNTFVEHAALINAISNITKSVSEQRIVTFALVSMVQTWKIIFVTTFSGAGHENSSTRVFIIFELSTMNLKQAFALT